MELERRGGVGEKQKANSAGNAPGGRRCGAARSCSYDHPGVGWGPKTGAPGGRGGGYFVVVVVFSDRFDLVVKKTLRGSLALLHLFTPLSPISLSPVGLDAQDNARATALPKGARRTQLSSWASVPEDRSRLDSRFGEKTLILTP